MINPSEDSKSLKDLLKDNQSLIKIIQSSKNIIERDYNDQEKVNEDFLFTMLSKGYIDENYSDFLSTSYEELFEKDEYAFLNNLKENNEPNFGLAIINIKSVKNKIKSYQWSSPSILNNDILTYLINNSQLSQLNSFIIAISNYYEKYQKDNFIDQYIESINEPNDREKIINILLNELYNKIKTDIPTNIKKTLLLSFFSNNSGPLFCNLLNINSDDDNNIAKLLNIFFEKKQSILAYTLIQAEKNEDLKKKLYVMNLEIEKISIYSDSTQQLIINNAMFQISKYNLDYLLTKQKELPPHYYYDYIRSKRNVKAKIFNSKDIEKFVDEILLTDDKVYISPEGIVDLLFTTPIEDDIAEKVTAKLSNEFIDLTYLPKFSKDNTTAILALNTNLFHILIQQNKLKIDLNNVLYISSSATTEDIISFTQKQINRQLHSTSVYKIDPFAKNNFLNSFYSFLLTEQKVNTDLFEKESVFLIQHDIDIIDLTTSLIQKNNGIPTNKMPKLIELAFTRSTPNKNSSNTFLTIIKIGFIYFRQIFTIIKNKSGNNWKINMSIILMNEDNILSENHIDQIIDQISLDELRDIIKLKSLEIDFSSKKVAENILNERRFNSLLEKYGHAKILDFINSIKNNITNKLEDNLIALIEQKNIYHIHDIASKYGINQNAITDYNYRGSYFENIINQLQNDFHFNWEILKTTTLQLSKSRFYSPQIINNLFILGRYFYDAMENGKIYINDFFSEKNSTLLNLSKRYSLNPILCGLVFEAYFNQKGILKKDSKKMFFDELIEQLEFYKGSKCLNFISECLKLFNNRIVYIPGDPDITFKVNGNIIDNEIEINSITCFGIELLTKPQSISDTGIIPVKGTKNDLIRSIRQYFTIPVYRIKLEPSFENYMVMNGIDFIQPLSSIAPLINQNKVTDKRLKDIKKDF
ncbi:MAG: hypothetical protein IJM92_09240 [Fibrobacter sp.]|uniref:hypothetical protein n=1 Tax=Fibrobacter sp. TaxID=35828 RepID=UPI0025BF474A|nr:hypothetical protein [Fibrobacter sp.]MBQ7079827.1 hypothetical protein [Fibrobacter sp.]